MSYSLKWYIPERVICLRLVDQPDLEELKEVNQKVEEMLQKSKLRAAIIINAAEMRAGYHTSNWLRDTQTYMYRSKVKQVLFISDNKLNRLISIMAFSLSNARLIQLDKWHLVTDQLKRQGFEHEITSAERG